jgi:hypothetical protein
MFENLKYLNPFGMKAGYIGWLNRKNLGDEVLFHIFQDLFNRLTFLPFKHTAKTQLCEKILRKKIFNAVFLGGGTLINSAERDRFQSAQKYYSPTYVFGAGVKQPEFWDQYEKSSEGLQPWCEALGRCVYVGVRGPLSQELLEQAGFKNAEIIGDPAISFLEKSITPKKGKKHVGINVGDTHHRIWGTEEKFFAVMREFIAVLLEKNWNVTFLSVYDKDKKVIDDLKKELKKDLRCVEVYHSQKQAADFLKDCDVFVGQKLHAVILALCAHTPSVMLEYQPKCRDFMTSVGLEKFNKRTDNFTTDELYECVEELYNKRDTYQELIHNRLKPYADLQRKRADEIMTKILSS